MRVATRMIKRGLPCLQLYGEPAADVRVSDRHADIYDSYADMFTVLVVKTFKLPKFHGCCCSCMVFVSCSSLVSYMPTGLSVYAGCRMRGMSSRFSPFKCPASLRESCRTRRSSGSLAPSLAAAQWGCPLQG